MKSGEVTGWPKVRVSLRAKWTDPWVTLTASHGGEYLACEMAMAAAAPTIPTAQFTWKAGLIRQHNQAIEEVYVPLERLGEFVKVELEEKDGRIKLLWVGTFEGDGREIHGGGVLDDEGVAAETVDQHLTAYGIEYLLERTRIQEAWAVNRETGPDVDEFKIDTVPIFNERYVAGISEVGNRSAYPQDHHTNEDEKADSLGASYVFSPGTEVWNAKDIVEYLLLHYRAKGVEIAMSGQFEELGNIIPQKLNLAGMSVREALNKLIDRRRGLGYVLRYFYDDDSGDGVQELEAGTPAPPEMKVKLHVFTLLESEVTAGSYTFAANTEVVEEVDVGGLGIDQVKILKSLATAYGTIRVLGERARSMFTLSIADGTLKKAWTDTERNAYKAGANSALGQVNDAQRGTDALRHVYTTFIPTADFHAKTIDGVRTNWWVKDGEGGGGARANPLLYDDKGGVNKYKSGAIREWDLSRIFEDRLLIPEERALADVHAEYRKPFAIVEYPAGKFAYVDILSQTSSNVPSASVRMTDNQMGVVVQFTPAHAWTPLAEWNAATVALATTQAPSDPLDYNSLIVTVCAQLDQRLRYEVTVEGNDPERVLFIEVPEAHYWYQAPGTITEITNGVFQREYEGTVLRNDIAVLERTALLARAWYGRRRSAVSWATRGLETTRKVGELVAELKTDAAGLNNYAVNTVITEVVWLPPQGQSEVHTDYVELDFVEQ